MAPASRNPATLAALAAVGTLAFFVAYALASHWLMTHAAHEPWAVAVIFGPLVLAVAAAAFKRGQRGVLAGCAIVVAVLVWVVQHGGVEDANRMYVLQHAGIHLALAWSFGITLRPGSTPLITAMARTVHQVFTPEMQAYTRWLTRAWVIYFVGMVVLSFVIYLLAPWGWWSLFCNVLTPLFAVAFFVIEHGVRYWRHPHFERVSLRRALNAYKHSEAGTDGAPRR